MLGRLWVNEGQPVKGCLLLWVLTVLGCCAQNVSVSAWISVNNQGKTLDVNIIIEDEKRL